MTGRRRLGAGGGPRRFIGWFLEKLYTDLAWFYDTVATITSAGQWWTWQQAVEPKLVPGRLLELGHGTGRLLQRQLEHGRNVIALDRSSSMIRTAARRLRRSSLPAPLVQADATALPFASNSFDGAYSTFPSEYIADSRTVWEALRVLKPSARLLIIPYAWITGGSLVDLLAHFLYRITGQSPSPGELNWPPIEIPAAIVESEIIAQERAHVLVLSVSAPVRSDHEPGD
ncbi:MAG: methyltransferase domain-containing protein [Anaerolineales bacterium]